MHRYRIIKTTGTYFTSFFRPTMCHVCPGHCCYRRRPSSSPPPHSRWWESICDRATAFIGDAAPCSLYRRHFAATVVTTSAAPSADCRSSGRAARNADPYAALAFLGSGRQTTSLRYTVLKHLTSVREPVPFFMAGLKILAPALAPAPGQI